MHQVTLGRPGRKLGRLAGLLLATLLATAATPASAQITFQAPVAESPFEAQALCSVGGCTEEQAAQAQRQADAINEMLAGRFGWSSDAMDPLTQMILGNRQRDFELSFENRDPLFLSLQGAVSVTGGPSSLFELRNQPYYTVGLGGVPFRYSGARVRMTESLNSLGECGTSALGSLAAYTGWASEVSEIGGLHHSAWVKGFITQHLEMAGGTFTDCICSGCQNGARICTSTDYAYRFSLHPAAGGPVVDFYRRPQEQVFTSTNQVDPLTCFVTPAPPPPLPTSYWSTDGSMLLDVSDPARPVVHYADGSMEEFGRPLLEVEPTVGAEGCGQMPPAAFYGCHPERESCLPTTPLYTTDRNGNRTRYSISADGNLETVTDPRGRVTTLTYEDSSSSQTAFKRLRTVEVSGAGGAPLRYTVNWIRLHVNTDNVFPDIHCLPHGFPPDPSCGVWRLDLVSSIDFPDGRRYTFEYGPWGNLTRVTEPAGVVRTYEYGDTSNTDYAQQSLALTCHPTKFAGGSPACDVWTGQAPSLQTRGLLRERVFPSGQGAGRPEYLTSTAYEYVRVRPCAVDVVGAALDPTTCCAQVWKKTTLPDGTINRSGQCVNAMPALASSPNIGPGIVTAHGWEIGQEVWRPGAGGASTPCTPGAGCLSASYTADKAAGRHFFEFDAVRSVIGVTVPPGDRRPTRMVNVHDGLATTTTFSYGDTIDLRPGGQTVLRNTKNVTRQCVFRGGDATSCDTPGTSAKVAETVRSYFHPSPYHDEDAAVTRNILRLSDRTTVLDPVTGAAVTRSDTAFDQFALEPSMAPNRVEVGLFRGNPTTVTTYAAPGTGGGGVSTISRYFDTGDQRQLQDARNNITTTTPEFGLCADKPRLTHSAQNMLGHPTRTVTDCFTGLTLSVRDANGQVACSKYDALGRLLETAVPGDSLTPGGVADTANCPSGGAGPTATTQYFRLGLEVADIDQQRTVVRTKDGSTDGRYAKSFLDGLGRTLQVRSEVDPSTSGGFAEVVGTTEYDNMGRVFRTHVPCFATASDTRTDCPNPAFSTTLYDALGRVTSLTAPGLPATTTTYDSDGTSFLTTVTPVSDLTRQKRIRTDVLGRTVETAAKWSDCGGCFLATTMTYDAAGRVLSVRDPGGNTMRMTYDGLGRKRTMADPDMGGFADRSWTYDYDPNGNLVSQTDAKGQTIGICYDALNRIILKDLPPLQGSCNRTGAGCEDVTYFYDGEQAPPSNCVTPDFAIAVSPAAVSAGRNGSAAATVTVTGLGGFSGPTALSIAGLPGGVTPSFSPASVTPSPTGAPSTLTLSISGTAPGGTFPLTITGTSGGLSHSTSLGLTVTAPDFSVSVSPNPASVAQGQNKTATVTVGSLSGFNGAVALSVSGVPTGVTANLSPTSVVPPSGGSTTASLTFLASASAPTGTFTVTVTGTGGGFTRTGSLTLNVTPPPDFTIAVSPSPVNVALGGSASTTVTIGSVNGFSSATNLSVSGMPTGVSASFSSPSPTPPAGGSATSTLTLSASGTASTGSFTLTVSGSAGALGHSVSLGLNVNVTPDFQVSVSPGSVSALGGQIATTTVTVTSLGGFGGAVGLSVSGLPAGVTASWSPTPPNLNVPAGGSASATLKLSVGTGTPNGTYNLTVAGSSGNTTRTASLTLAVGVTVDFTLGLSTPSLSVTQGSNGSLTVTVASQGGFSSPVNLAASGLPAGVTVSFVPTSPAPPSGGSASSTLTLSASSSATTGGPFTLTIAGTSGSLTHTASLSLTVNAALPPDFSLSLSPTALGITQGGSGSVTVTVGSQNGFSAATSLTASGLPAGVTAAFSLPSVTPPSGGSASSTLTLSASSTAATGSFSVTVTGTSGAVAHGATLTLTVGAAAPCTFALTPTSVSFGHDGGSGSFKVTPSAAGCSWTASSNASWITVTGGASGTDIGTVLFNVAVNTPKASRTGTISVSGQAFTVSQTP